jgi:hypothetical protein
VGAGKVTQGINRREQALRGATRLWQDFGKNPTALASFHGIPVDVARRLAPLATAGKYEEFERQLIDHPEWYWIWLLLYGGRGSAKTFTIAARCWFFALTRPGISVLVARKRKEQLRNTFLGEFEKVGKILSDDHLDVLGEMLPERDGAMEYLVHSPNPKEPSKIIFAIEPDQATDKDIMERWKGYNLHGAVTEETPQLKEITVHTIRSCVRVKNDAAGNPVQRWMATITNPVKRDSWLGEFKTKCMVGLQMMQGDYRMAALTKKRPACLFIHSTPADNVHHLADNYIEEQIEALRAMGREDLIDSWVYGEDEAEQKGKPVYGAQFSKLHIDPNIRYNPYKPLLRGWDFGYHRPACVFVQEDDKGCLNVLGEMLGKDETAKQFALRVKAHCADNYMPAPPEVRDYGDPAGAQQTDKGDTTFMILRAEGIRINFRPTSIDAGIKHIQGLLTRMRGGRPELCCSPAAADLIEGFKRGYHYPKFHDGTVGKKPHKDGYFDHLQDAFRYLAVNLHALVDFESSEGYNNPTVGAMTMGGMDPMDMPE